MILKSLSLYNFKNIREGELTLSPNINCFLGNNGMGKTNLLDAIYYLTFCKSSKNVTDSLNIQHNEEFMMLRGIYTNQTKGDEKEIYCGVKRGGKKVFKHDGKEYDRLSDHIGEIPLVLINPEDVELVKEGSEVRRRFIDQTLSQFDREYLNAVITYNKCVTSRNVMLRNNQQDPSLYEVIEDQMSYYAHTIYQKRQAFIEQFIPVFNRYYNEISTESESVTLTYQSHLAEGNLAIQLKDTRQRDSIIGYTTHGTHKDELIMNMDNHPVKKLGSQGQVKSYVIALKFAQYNYLKELRKVSPLLLLDDIFDKLDTLRVEKIMDIVSGNNFGQTFITDTNREYLDSIIHKTQGNNNLYLVEHGTIETI